MQTRGRWIVLPENHAARQAAERVLACVRDRGPAGKPSRATNPLFLHGPPGTGKTRLVGELVSALTESTGLIITQMPASDLAVVEDSQAAPLGDVVVVEDVQHLPARRVEDLVGLIDRCLGRQRQLVLTAVAGPAQLTDLPVRLTSRLAQGLVVGLEPLSPASRREYLQQRLAERGLDVPDEVFAWLANQATGSLRQIEGLLTQLEQLTASLGRPVRAEDLARLTEDDPARRPTMERIVQRVGRYFRVEPDRLCSGRRSREVLLPRQVSMYLARQLTGLSLEQIGAYFGGRDHTTVLHACRKVEQALSADAGLGGAVRQLHADLA
jgi:chromosomal replication initiator protein